jgi:hypothetical protein
MQNNQENQENQEFFTRKEAAKFLKVCEATIKRAVDSRKIAYINNNVSGNKYAKLLFTKQDLLQYLATQRIPSLSESLRKVKGGN